MEYKYKHHHEIKSLPFLISHAFDQKRELAQKIHSFNILTYEKGSQKIDYLIRDQIQGIQDDLNRYQGAIELFDYGKGGDLKAYEDLLIFFVKNFIDKFEVSDKLKLLDDTIAKNEEKNEIHGLRYAGRYIIRKKNLYFAEFHGKLRNFKIQLYNSFIPSLRKFLNDVNHILFFEKITASVNNLRSKRNFSRNSLNIEYLTVCIRSFIWFNHKINTNECSDISIKEFILNTFNDFEPEETPKSKAEKDKNVLTGIVNKILLGLNGQLQQMEEILCAEDRDLQQVNPGNQTEKSILSKRLELIQRLKKLLNDLCTINACEKSFSQAEDRVIHASDIIKQEGEQYLFHVPGAFDFSLKTMGNYMTNTLVFMYSWILRELYRHNLPDDLIDFLIVSLTYSENFYAHFCSAVNISFYENNQKKSFLRGEIQHYIPMDLAEKTISAMDSIYNQLNDALMESYLSIPATSLKRNDILSKKMIIVINSLNNVWKMIQEGLEPHRGAMPPPYD
jgi:hypothetical protein